MTAQWMAYCIATGVLLALAARAAEGALRAARLPTRAPWAAALLLSLALPAAARWLPRTASAVPDRSAPDAVPGAGGAFDLPAIAFPYPTPAARLAHLDHLLALGWVLGSGAVLLVLAGLAAALHLRRRRWTEHDVDGTRVLVAPRTGPAVVGFLRPRIVLPRWVVDEADAPRRALLLEHEREHLRAGDPRLLLLGLMVVAALPFSPAAWWMLRRLRLAVEVDCDARVLARRGDVRAYGGLLVEVGRRGTGMPLPLVAFSAPESFLARRIQIMTSPPVRAPRLRATGFAILGAALAAAACEAPGPMNPTPIATEQVYLAKGAADGMQPAELTPRQAIERYYPDVFTRGAGENTRLLFVVSAGGEVLSHQRTAVVPEPGADGRGEAIALRTMEGLDIPVESVERINVLRVPAGMMGPDRFELVWIQQLPSPASAAGGAVSGTSVQADDAPPADLVRERIARYMPNVAARGTTAEYVWFVVDPAGEVVAHGDSRDAAGMRRDLDAIARIHVLKGERVVVNGHPVPVIWLQLRG